jgi:integrase
MAMPHRTSKGGTYRLDRRFPGVGRIAVASGATTRAPLRARNDLLTRLFDKGRLDILRAIKVGHVTVTEVLDADRRDALNSLTGDTKVLSRRFWEAVDEWLPTSARGAETRRRYKVSMAKLRTRGAIRETATVADLANVDWKTLEATWPGSDADYNHVWRAVGKFLSDALGDTYHPFRRCVTKAIPKRKERERVPDLSPELFWKIVHAAPAHVRPAFVCLAITGLRTGEYLRLTKAHLKPATFSVDVPGTKTEGSAATLRVDERLWRWVEAAVPPPVQYGWLRKYWKRALAAVDADTTLRLHDLRHCTGQWAIDSGQPEAKVQVMLRHATPAMTRRYVRQRDRGEIAEAVADALLRSA